MNVNWKHILLTALGTALPALNAVLTGAPVLTAPVLEQALATGLVVFLATAIKGWLPSSGAQS